jgi:hypothetical protein
VALRRLLSPDDPRLPPALRVAEAWSRVPMALRYAAESLTRGRTKVSPVLTALTAVERATRDDEIQYEEAS